MLFILNSSIFKRIYQLDFVTPGKSPSDAILRKQRRQIPNLRIKALGRPQMGHLLYCLTANFGFRAAFTLSDVFAKTNSFNH
jgi:hypothetical protein